MTLSNQILNPKYTYIEKHYNKNEFDNWRNHVWWENEEWKEFLPTEEHHRWKKFYNQACKNVHNKYEKSMGYHFVEILKMRDLKKNGYKWLYEDYYLIKNARPTEQKFYNGTEKNK